MPTAVTTLEARYGRTRSRVRRGRVLAVTGGALVLLVVGAWGVWTGFGGAAGTLDPETVGMTVDGPRSTTVRWTVTGRGGTALVCAIEAKDPSGVVVGLVEVSVPAGSSDRSGTTVVRTVRTASNGLIDSCRDA